tara:strand:- start:115 stop:495 length:381 start_codon:yes stop_codon:yes gene_type:complete
MTDEAWQNPKKDPSEREVAFDYVKSHDFRVVWADGAVGTLTPNGLVHFALYAERQAIPRRQVFEIVPVDETTGTLGKEVMEKQISRGSIVREMSCDVFLSTESAENLALWLLEQVARAEEMREQTK